ncbi:diphosphomevalonate decarboxylase [Patescibacteria group bacterium]
MRKTTVQACTDVALVKYWGKKDEALRLPENGSVSVKLDGLDTITTVEFQEELAKDIVVIEGDSKVKETQRVSKHLDRIRKVAGKNVFARVKSKNTFPKGTGLSSSGSGFAALTVAASKAIGFDLSEKEMSILARQGSGTACRCVCEGFVEWKDGNESEASYSESIFLPEHWDIRDVVVVVDEGMKKTSSTKGHTTAQSSIAYHERQSRIIEKINKVKTAIEKKDFLEFGNIVEKEALEFHSILLTSTPPMIAWYPGTVQVIHEVQKLREEGISAFFTINTGFNVHVLTLPKYEDVVLKRMNDLSLVKKTLVASVGGGPKEIGDHLF